MSKSGIGFYELEEFKISNLSDGESKSIDIKEIVGDFNIVESMDLGYLYGSALIQDTENLIQSFPLNGEERITISYTDWFGEKHTDEMFLYAIDNIRPSKDSNQELNYTIHFCSIGRFLTATQTVRFGFEASTMEIAQELFERYFKGAGIKKELEIDTEDTYVQRLVIPSYEPIEAMNFLARKSVFNDEEMIDNVRFFETRKRYWFAGAEQLAVGALDSSDGEINKFVQNSLYGEDPADLHMRMAHIQKIDYMTRVNTMDDLKSGMYNRTVIEYDINTKEFTETEFVLNDSTKSYFSDNKGISPIHTKNFTEGYFIEPYEDFRIKDWSSSGPGLRPDTMFSKAYGAKVAKMMYETKYPIEINVFGRNNLFAGDPVEIYVMKTQSGANQEIDEEHSGKYLAYSVNNQFFRSGKYMQTIRLIRPGVIRQNNDGPSVKGIEIL